MSSNFLQRFKGKTQQISKDGVTNILGNKNPDAVYNPNQAIKERNFNSVNNQRSTAKNQPKQKISKVEKKPIETKTVTSTAKTTQQKVENPFLVSNPFYLDEEEREREEIQRKQMKKLEEETRKAELKQKQEKDPKEITKTSSYSRSQDKKKGKQWVKLGGLGANIGGDDWLEKKKKQQKMQEFAGQVKSVNADRIKPPRPDRKEEKKQPNARDKALEYSRNVPKPVVKRMQREESDEREERSQQRKQEGEQLTELQLYEMKHEQLKKMINNQY